MRIMSQDEMTGTTPTPGLGGLSAVAEARAKRIAWRAARAEPQPPAPAPEPETTADPPPRRLRFWQPVRAALPAEPALAPRPESLVEPSVAASAASETAPQPDSAPGAAIDDSVFSQMLLAAAPPPEAEPARAAAPEPAPEPEPELAAAPPEPEPKPEHAAATPEPEPAAAPEPEQPPEPLDRLVSVLLPQIEQVTDALRAAVIGGIEPPAASPQPEPEPMPVPAIAAMATVSAELGPGMRFRLEQVGYGSDAALAAADPAALRASLGEISRLLNVEAWIAAARSNLETGAR